ncbi:DUF2057 domain-containing protein [Vibrio sp. JC009]|uniref:DUF2057 family protein n=1 Tax=Vibrio sp. JC009 TaxID=2912314 RepID=UPI0023B11A43|nr:DUF2057 family protein [Vibrio sp. JC009]WED22413.1 DUF2057 domain-containing protein [Vibrio sp. JC009]
MRSAFCFLLTLLFAGSLSAAELIPEKHIRLLLLNGEQPKYDAEPAPLEPGFTQVAIKVRATIGRGSNRKEFESKPFLLMFEAGEQDIAIVAPELKSYERAERQFRGKPDIKLISAGKEISYEYAPIQGRKGFMPYRDLDKLVAKYNQEQQIQVGDQPELTTNSAMYEGTPDAEQLKAWYQKASPSEQEKFKNWIVGLR